MLTTLADLDNTYGAPGTTTYCYGIGRQGSHGNAHSGAGGASSLLRTCENVSQTEPTGLLLVAGGGGGGSAAGATFDGHSGGSGGIASGWGTAGFKQGNPQITGDTGSGGSQDMVGGGVPAAVATVVVVPALAMRALAAAVAMAATQPNQLCPSRKILVPKRPTDGYHSISISTSHNQATRECSFESAEQTGCLWRRSTQRRLWP